MDWKKIERSQHAFIFETWDPSHKPKTNIIEGKP
jgi:hypothetical protein